MRATAVVVFFGLMGSAAAANPAAVIVPDPAGQSYVEVPVGPTPEPLPLLPTPPPKPALALAPVPPLLPVPRRAEMRPAVDGAAPSAPISVLIVYQGVSAAGRDRAAALARSLDANGISAVSFAKLARAPRAARVGFLYGEDSAAAAVVARAADPSLALPPPVRLTQADAHTTCPGTVEITVAD
jgi:hypothetical protein